MTGEQHKTLLNIYKSIVSDKLDMEFVKSEHLKAKLELDKVTVTGGYTTDVKEYLWELETILYK